MDLIGIILSFHLPPSLGRAKAGNPVRLAAIPFKGFAEGAMPDSKKPEISNLEMLMGLKPGTMAAREEARKFRELDRIRRGYEGPWNAAARYFYLELIQAYGLGADWEETLMDLAKARIGIEGSRKGRPRKDALANVAARLKKDGLSYSKIAIFLNREHGKEIATAGSIRKLLKRLKSRKSAGTPDKMRK